MFCRQFRHLTLTLSLYFLFHNVSPPPPPTLAELPVGFTDHVTSLVFYRLAHVLIPDSNDCQKEESIVTKYFYKNLSGVRRRQTTLTCITLRRSVPLPHLPNIMSRGLRSNLEMAHRKVNCNILGPSEGTANKGNNVET